MKRAIRYVSVGILAFGMMLGGCSFMETNLSDGNFLEKDTHSEAPASEASAPETTDGLSQEADASDGTGAGTQNPSGEQETSVEVTVPAEGLLHPFVNTKVVHYYNDSRRLCLVNAEVDSIELNADEQAAYPQLQAALNAKFQEDEKDMYQRAADSKEYAEEYADTFGMEWGDVFSFSRKVSLGRCDSEIFSFVADYYEFSGGAHGMGGYGCYNINPRTGEELTATDLIASPLEFAVEIERRLNKDYPDAEIYASPSLALDLQQTIEENRLNVLATNRGVRVYINRYEIAAYSEGDFIMDFNLEEYGNLLKPICHSGGKKYIERCTEYDTFLADVNNDGASERIRFERRVEYSYYNDQPYADITGFTVWVNDEKLTVDWYCYDLTGYFVRNNQKSYLYLITRSDNDYDVLVPINLSGGYPARVGNEGINADVAAYELSGGDYDAQIYEYTGQYYALTDPDSMQLSSNTDYMSTAEGMRNYRVGEDGAPTPNEGSEIYQIRASHYEFTARIDVQGTQVDEAGNVFGEYTIHAGDTVVYYKTDNDTFADLLTREGYIVRVHLEKGWPIMIQGVTLEDAFDGIVFAG